MALKLNLLLSQYSSLSNKRLLYISSVSSCYIQVLGQSQYYAKNEIIVIVIGDRTAEGISPLR